MFFADNWVKICMITNFILSETHIRYLWNEE